MNLQESGEMYLETILRLTNKRGAVRSIDVSEEMGFSKPSVSRALKKLVGDGFIKIEENGYINLTASGRNVAEKIYERHNILTKMLMNLGVDKKTASEDACRIEHHISDESFAAIKRHLMQNMKDQISN